MPCKIHNRSNNKVLVRLTSGQTIHLGPLDSTDVLADADVRYIDADDDGPGSHNPRLDPLIRRRVVDVEVVKPAKKSAAAKAPAKKSATKKSPAKRRARRSAGRSSSRGRGSAPESGGSK